MAYLASSNLAVYWFDSSYIHYTSVAEQADASGLRPDEKSWEFDSPRWYYRVYISLVDFAVWVRADVGSNPTTLTL